MRFRTGKKIEMSCRRRFIATLILHTLWSLISLRTTSGASTHSKSALFLSELSLWCRGSLLRAVRGMGVPLRRGRTEHTCKRSNRSDLEGQKSDVCRRAGSRVGESSGVLPRGKLMWSHIPSSWPKQITLSSRCIPCSFNLHNVNQSIKKAHRVSKHDDIICFTNNFSWSSFMLSLLLNAKPNGVFIVSGSHDSYLSELPALCLKHRVLDHALVHGWSGLERRIDGVFVSGHKSHPLMVDWSLKTSPRHRTNSHPTNCARSRSWSMYAPLTTFEPKQKSSRLARSVSTTKFS